MNYEEYLVKRDELVAQIRDKLEGKKGMVRDQRLDDISGLCSLFYGMLYNWDLVADRNVDRIRSFWRSIYQQQRQSFGYGCVMTKTVDEVIAEFPAFKYEHQQLIDHYYFNYDCVSIYINNIIELGYLDLKIPEVVKEPCVM